jgi:hypothetical protein
MVGLHLQGVLMSVAALRTRKWRLARRMIVACAVAGAAGLAACTAEEVSGPDAELRGLRPRANSGGCVSTDSMGVPADTAPAQPDGTCLPGFDYIPWW